MKAPFSRKSLVDGGLMQLYSDQILTREKCFVHAQPRQCTQTISHFGEMIVKYRVNTLSITDTVWKLRQLFCIKSGLDLALASIVSLLLSQSGATSTDLAIPVFERKPRH